MNLSGIWQCRVTDGAAHDYTIPASVPGCVHTDLQAAGILPDLFWRDHNDLCQWVEDCDVTYTRTFVPETPELPSVITFRGLDTYCEIFLNGMKIGEADDMFIPWTFPATGLRAGENTLEVRFRSPIREVKACPKRHGAFTTERINTRRMQCTYGWDWVARFVTMGIWREVTLDVLAADRLEHVYVWTESVNSYAAKVGVKAAFSAVSGDAWAELEITDPDGVCVWKRSRRILATTRGASEAELSAFIDLPGAKLWYPMGYGEQPLYTLRIRTGETVSETVFGIRTVEILEIEDAPGSPEAEKAAWLKTRTQMQEWDRNEGSSSFILLVNGLRIFCPGANWVPAEPFPSAETPEKFERLARLARDGNVRMLRVWGGGIFEDDAFYSACDRLGILVTQDFLMACGAYPEDEDDFIEKLKREARAGALQLRNHPSLVWWSGDNENAVRGDENMPHYNGRRAALEAIGPVLSALDPHRRFLPSSPYGGVPYASGVRGTTHNTQYLGNFFAWVRENDFTDYRSYFETYLARFCAEQPAMGMPYVSSLRKFLTDADIFGEDTSMSEYHTKNNPGLGAITLYGYVERLARGMFGEFADGHDRTKKMQLLHTEWVRISLELFRRNAWFSSGIIYWMYNDCWPAANSWSIVDYYCAPKPAYYMFRRCAAPVMSSVTREDGEYRVYVCHTGTDSINVTGRLYVYDIESGAEPWELRTEFFGISNESRCVLRVPEEVLAKRLGSRAVLLWDMETDCGRSDRAFFLPENFGDMQWESGDAEILAEDGETLTVKAPVTIPTLLLDVPYVLDDNSFFMKKGEVRILRKIAKI